MINDETMKYSVLFQSTLLMRGATKIHITSGLLSDNFNPRSSCEERPCNMLLTTLYHIYFNPRSSCEERHAVMLQRA